MKKVRQVGHYQEFTLNAFFTSSVPFHGGVRDGVKNQITRPTSYSDWDFVRYDTVYSGTVLSSSKNLLPPFSTLNMEAAGF